MPNETLDAIRAAEQQAETIRSDARAKARQMIAAAQASADQAVSDAEAEARKFRQDTLRDVQERTGRLADSEAEEARYDAQRITRHAERVRPAAVAYITEQITGKAL
jgi:vacuolar-type H+-ATPase subunit H